MPRISFWRTVGPGLLLLNLALTSVSCAKFDAEPQAASVAVEKASEPPTTRNKQQGEDITTKAPRKLVRPANVLTSIRRSSDSTVTFIFPTSSVTVSERSSGY